MCQGHRCTGCGSQMVYSHQAYGRCLNIANAPSLSGGACERRQIACCPLCNIGLWRNNLRSFVYGQQGQGWIEVEPGWAAANVPDDQRVSHIPNRDEVLQRWQRDVAVQNQQFLRNLPAATLQQRMQAAMDSMNADMTAERQQRSQVAPIEPVCSCQGCGR